MHFTKGKKKLLVGMIMAALFTGAWSNADVASVIRAKDPVTREGETAEAVPTEPMPTPVEPTPIPTQEPTPTPVPAYLDVANIPATSGAISVDNTLVLDELDFAANTATSATLSWTCSSLTDGTYYIYRYNETKMRYDYVADSKEQTYVCEGLKPSKKYYFTVCAFDGANMVQGAFSYPVQAYTKPRKVQNLGFVESKKDKINIQWDTVADVDGYIIYHAEGSGAFEEAGKTTETTFADEGLLSGKNYRYKVRAYVFYEDNMGAVSSTEKMTTLPATPAVTVKGGDKKARIKWNSVTGAAGYYLYWYDGTEYQLLTTLEGKSSTEYIHTGLENDTSSQYKVEAYRIFNETEYKSDISAMKEATVSKQATVTAPTLYATKAKFKKSSAYLLNADFQKAVNYSKSFVIPGVTGTNIDGFYSRDMCPQGITFAGSYLLLSAYDKMKEENSVIYVMKKSNRKLVMTVVLPDKIHAGGIAYDGENIWVAATNTVCSFPYADITKAIKEGKKECLVSYNTVCTLTHQAGSLTYYKNKLWAASYDELNSGYLGVYSISKKSSSPTLKLAALARVPTRVQGLTFTNGGKLILSRSCQTNSTQRGFLHVLDIYQPNITNLSKGTVTLGSVKKTVDMPTMNEEIAINGSYLYVNFESVAFSTAVQRMDRVCALKTTSIASLKKEKK